MAVPPPSNELAIQASGLRRSFDDLLAVAGIALEVRVGEVFGILGPNGPEKTTTVRLLNGLICPDAGEMRVNPLTPSLEAIYFSLQHRSEAHDERA